MAALAARSSCLRCLSENSRFAIETFESKCGRSEIVGVIVNRTAELQNSFFGAVSSNPSGPKSLRPGKGDDFSWLACALGQAFRFLPFSLGFRGSACKHVDFRHPPVRLRIQRL